MSSSAAAGLPVAPHAGHERSPGTPSPLLQPRHGETERHERPAATPAWAWLALVAILLLGLLLRLKGLHNPILDHPGWRQGDEAAIARNFATLHFNPLYPQVDYDGPPPNHVELELQIVPFLAACVYRLVGVHEIVGRLISIAFSLGTIAVLFAFGRWLFASALAGLGAALLYAIMPGAVYYGRTFQPEATMAFFLTAGAFAGARFLLDAPDARSWRGFWPAAVLLALALLAKSVAIVVLVPLAAASVARFGWLETLRRPQSWALLGAALVPLGVYDRIVSSHAEWHWASGITRLHVIPSFVHAFASGAALSEKLGFFGNTFSMLATTMLGPFAFALLVLGFLTPLRSRSSAFLLWWLIACVAYAYVVVTVERVDYYLFPYVPLAALVGGAYLAAGLDGARWSAAPAAVRRSAIVAAAIGLAVVIVVNRAQVAAYYEYNPSVYRAAKALDHALPKGALIVMGHYDPSVMYTIGRKGWEEDPYLWTPFDEQSAIRKGARYFIDIEGNRLRRNVELHAWLQRFPVIHPEAKWPVYVTDPARVLPGAERRWREFRNREKAGKLRRPASTVPPSAGLPATEE